jgi:thioredoxin reductase/Pyruvate/2-oxoacid:ferredoxin oxidoreductase delta subunit
LNEVFIENAISYFIVALLSLTIVIFYLRSKKKKSLQNIGKLESARRLGLHEPVSLHPVVDQDTCIGSGACITACPEKDILGIVHGKAQVINASRCVGHGACFHACPVHAITLCIGTEKRGVDLPHVSREFETNIPGLYIAGELGGMALIKNAVEQGKQAVQYFMKKMNKSLSTDYDLVIVGAGPAGISATLAAVKNKLKCVTLEQDTLGGTVFNFPRQKVVMTSPMELPLYGQVKVRQTSKTGLLDIWKLVLKQNEIIINENEKVESIEKDGEIFSVRTSKAIYTSKGVILAIGRRGSPRKLGVPGEEKEKVAYRLLEPEFIKGKKVLVVGGGDSAIENALMIAEADDNNRVTLSYRGDTFARIKPENSENISVAAANKRVRILFNSNVKEIMDDKVILTVGDQPDPIAIDNDLVYIFAGGTLPTAFLQQIGVKVTAKFGEAILKHDN